MLSLKLQSSFLNAYLPNAQRCNHAADKYVLLSRATNAAE
jgi:hypothetical protein